MAVSGQLGAVCTIISVGKQLGSETGWNLLRRIALETLVGAILRQ
jgi:hypothetical protein